jgi:small-conductance mechanosensitive channel
VNQQFFDRKIRHLFFIALGLSLALFLSLFPGFPALGQQGTIPSFKSNTAPVILDGRRIFKVSSSQEFPALERAEMIENKLQQAVRSPDPITVTVRDNNTLPTIWLNDGYLLTVTERDSETGNDVWEQADRWKREIQYAVNRAQQERSLQFLQVAILRSALILICAMLTHWAIGKLWEKYLRRILEAFLPSENDVSQKQQKKQHRSVDVFLNLTLSSVRLGLWFAVFIYIANQFPVTRQWSYQVGGTIVTTLTSDIFSLDNNSYSIPDILVLLLLLWALIFTAKVLEDVLRSRILEATGISRGAQEVVAVIIRYSLICIGSLVLLQVWGLNLSSLTILASALGVGIGFGFQDIAKNFGSGLVLLFERPIQAGDFIEVGEYQGIVERVGARSTVIKTLDQISIIVPNSRFLETELINWDHDNSLSGLRLPVGIAYGSDVEKVKDSLLDVAKANPDVLTIPSPQVLFKGFGDSSLDFELRVWTRHPERQVVIKSDLYYEIEAMLRKRNIEIPFPQRDLHVRGSMPLELSPELKALLSKLISPS